MRQDPADEMFKNRVSNNQHQSSLTVVAANGPHLNTNDSILINITNFILVSQVQDKTSMS